ncbi:MAG: HAD family phosphatase [Chitinophagaceae bacterium]
MPAIKNIIFDLGGVIINIDFKKTENAFAELGFGDFKQYITQFHITPFFEEYETGQLDDETFIKGIQKIAGHPLSEQQVTEAWNALLLDFPPARIALLEKLKKHYRIFLLSNTNSLHYKMFQEKLFATAGKRLEDLFEKAYFSHTAHLRKPDAAIYQLVLDENKLNPEETLFIDDTESNFSGAHESGIQTFYLKPPMQITEMPLFQEFID